MATARMPERQNLDNVVASNVVELVARPTKRDPSHGSDFLVKGRRADVRL